MLPQKPIVRHFVACERVERSIDNRHCSLHNIIYAIRPTGSVPYPRIQPEIDFFALMTDGRGELTFSIELAEVDWEKDVSIYKTPGATMNLGENPLTVYAWPIQLKNVPFYRPGLHEFRLMCNDEIIAHETILLREIT